MLDAGFFQVPARRGGRPPRGRPERFVSGRVRSLDRHGDLAHCAQRCAHLGHADDSHREGTNPDHRERIPARWCLRLQDRQGNLEARQERRHSRTDAGGQRRTRLHHQRTWPPVSRVCDQGDRNRGHHPPRGCHVERPCRLERPEGGRLHCARRSCIAVSLTL